MPNEAIRAEIECVVEPMAESGEFQTVLSAAFAAGEVKGESPACT